LVKLELTPKLWGAAARYRQLIVENSREIFSLLEHTSNLEILELAVARLVFFDTLLLGLFRNTDGTFLCPRLRSIRLSDGIIMYPPILIRLLQQRSNL
jgi:hypothetical protein